MSVVNLLMLVAQKIRPLFAENSISKASSFSKQTNHFIWNHTNGVRLSASRMHRMIIYSARNGHTHTHSRAHMFKVNTHTQNGIKKKITNYFDRVTKPLLIRRLSFSSHFKRYKPQRNTKRMDIY